MTLLVLDIQNSSTVRTKKQTCCRYPVADPPRAPLAWKMRSGKRRRPRNQSQNHQQSGERRESHDGGMKTYNSRHFCSICVGQVSGETTFRINECMDEQDTIRIRYVNPMKRAGKKHVAYSDFNLQLSISIHDGVEGSRNSWIISCHLHSVVWEGGKGEAKLEPSFCIA